MTTSPSNVHELKIEIGKDILRESLRSIGTSPGQIEAVMRRSNDSYHIEAAETLRASVPDNIMSGIAQLADRALREVAPDTGDALMSVMSDLTSNFRYVSTWLRQDSPPYFTNLFRDLAELGEDEMRNTLESLAAYASGE